MNKKENIFIQWHLTTHGIAYFKHILSAFYSKKVDINKRINLDLLSQEELNETFGAKHSDGFTFDKIYYFTASDDVFDKLVTYKINNKIKFFDDAIFLGNNELKEAWKKTIDLNLNLEQEFLFISKEYETLIWEKIWRNIQHYKVNEQIKWLLEFSNFQNVYKEEQIEFIDMTKKHNIDDLRDFAVLTVAMHKELTKLKNKHKDATFVINVTLTCPEIQIIWFSFAQAGFLPSNTKFISVYDRKDLYPDKRFKLFEIKELPTNVISQITQKLVVYDKPISIERKEVEVKLQHYLKQGFAILLIGERGIGKSNIAEKYSKKANFVAVNCALFTNNTIAESILFGYVKGAFTDAKEDHQGVFEQADGGTLFFDEIHHLDKTVQAKLMKAIQTDENNYFRIRRLGDTNEKKVTCQLIFATNRTIEELRECLLLDFYDRIAQLIIELPPLRRTPNEIWTAFKMIWTQLKFESFYSFKEYLDKDENLMKWLIEQPLYGNYRDLQRIAIYYKTYLAFDREIKKIIKEKTAFDYTVSNYQKYSSSKSDENEFYNIERSPFENIKLYQKKLAQFLINEFSSAGKVVEFYKSKKIEISDKTILNWLKN